MQQFCDQVSYRLFSPQSQTKWLKGFIGTTGLIMALGISLSPNLSVSAGSCTRLKVVGGEGTEVEKTVVNPTIPLPYGLKVRDNWNTDFAVTSNVNYKRYVVTLTPKSSGTYSIRMYLKYSDSTADEFYGGKPTLTEGQPLAISGTPRGNEQPYQVNVFVGDVESIGKSFKVFVEGCP
jgi:hypothetical protein